jgi:hypothetical protein
MSCHPHSLIPEPWSKITEERFQPCAVLDAKNRRKQRSQAG